MPIYKAPVEDYKFLTQEVFDFSTLAELQGFKEISLDLVEQVMEETAKIVENEIFPLNQSSDHEGCKYENGEVKTPKKGNTAPILNTSKKEVANIAITCH